MSGFSFASPDVRFFHRPRMRLTMYSFSIATRLRCANHSGVGKYLRHGSKLRRLHSSMIGKYKFGMTSSLCSGVRLKIASAITCNVNNRNSSASSTGSFFPRTRSNFSDNLSTARVAMAMMSSKISTRNALDIRCRCSRHVSPSLVTSPVPNISRNGSYENSVSFL